MNKTTIRPLGSRVLIKRSQAQTSKGGILLPESAKEKPKEGMVIKVGSGATDENGNQHRMQVKEGDSVLFSPYAGTEVHYQDDEEEYLILSEDEILGIIQK